MTVKTELQFGFLFYSSHPGVQDWLSLLLKQLHPRNNQNNLSSQHDGRKLEPVWEVMVWEEEALKHVM